MYKKGGTATDDSLSASQLRARHGVQSNPRDFSTRQSAGGANGLFWAALLLIVVAILAGYLLFGSNSSLTNHRQEL